MNGRRRIVALAAALLVAPALGACAKTVEGAPLPVAVEEGVAPSTTKVSRPGGRVSTGSTSTRSTSGSGSGSASGGSVTIGTPKVVNEQPACTALISAEQVGQFTGGTATIKDGQRGFCSYDLKVSGQTAGLVMVVLSVTAEQSGAEKTLFEGNTAYRKSSSNLCDLRIALNDDRKNTVRALWVSAIMSRPSEPLCTTAEKIAKTVFTALPNG